MKNVGKLELAVGLAKKIDVSEADALFYVNTTLKNITSIIHEQGRLNINRFGKFTTRWKKERVGRNPKNGEPAKIKARRVVIFTSSKVTRT
jgi:integration host factor subunit alpha|tara:strand:- start:3878 stop:4150 length:273 start_codon:yes stop_codon:yes gene_type:complete